MDSCRLCLLTAAYPAPSEPTRGVFVENLALALGSLGWEVTVVAPRIGREDPLEETRRGLSVRRFRYPSGRRRLKEHERPPVAALALYLISGLRRTLGVIRRTGPAVVYAHWLLPTGLIGAVASAWSGRPLVIHAHGSDVHRFAVSSRLAAALARWSLRRAAGIVAVSRDLVRRIETDLGGGRSPIDMVPMGIDGSVFGRGDREEDRRALGLAGDRLELLYVGDLDPWKGIDDLARRLLESRELAGRVRLHLVGDGVLRPRLEILRAGAGSSLVLHGRLEPPAVARWCRAADLLVLPSRGEGSPLAVLEALSSGLPVLATPVGGLPDLVQDGETGWLEPVEEFPAAIARLVSAPDRLDAARSAVARRVDPVALSAEVRARGVHDILLRAVARPSVPDTGEASGGPTDRTDSVGSLEGRRP